MLSFLAVPLYVRLAVVLIGAVLIAVDIAALRRLKTPHPAGAALTPPAQAGQSALTAISIGAIGFLFFLFINHQSLPENELMAQHLQRAASFQQIYTQPSPNFIALSYNPMYYVLATPVAWVLGINSVTLRLVAIAGYIGTGLMLAVIVRGKTNSTWWALVAVGLFAGAYRLTDCYLDLEHVDSWFLFTALLGGWVLERQRTPFGRIGGIAWLLLSFWFKQHGSLFVVAGLLYLAWRDGVSRTIPASIVTLALGPGAYIFLGPSMFGPFFHFYTYQIGRQWTQLDADALIRLIGVIGVGFPALFVIAILGIGTDWLRQLGLWPIRAARPTLSSSEPLAPERRRFSVSIWQAQFFAAAAATVLGVLDPESANNVFIPLLLWSVLISCLTLHQWSQRASARSLRTQATHAAFFVSWALLIYNPASVIVPSNAPNTYSNLIAYMKSLPGQVWAPWLGQSEDQAGSQISAQWVPLLDVARGPGRDASTDPTVRTLLTPVIAPTHAAYVLNDYPLESDPMLHFLSNYYVLQEDLGDRFKPVRGLPYRWGEPAWPRYLYRFDPAKASHTAVSGLVPVDTAAR